MEVNVIDIVSSLGLPTALLIGAVWAVWKITNKYICYLEKSNSELTKCLQENTKGFNRNSVIMLELARRLGIKLTDVDKEDDKV